MKIKIDDVLFALQLAQAAIAELRKQGTEEVTVEELHDLRVDPDRLEELYRKYLEEQ